MRGESRPHAAELRLHHFCLNLSRSECLSSCRRAHAFFKLISLPQTTHTTRVKGVFIRNLFTFVYPPSCVYERSFICCQSVSNAATGRSEFTGFPLRISIYFANCIVEAYVRHYVASARASSGVARLRTANLARIKACAATSISVWSCHLSVN